MAAWLRSGKGARAGAPGAGRFEPPSIAAGRVKEKRSPSVPARTHAAGDGDGFRTGARHGRRRPRRPRPGDRGRLRGPTSSVPWPLRRRGRPRDPRPPDDREPPAPVPRPRLRRGPLPRPQGHGQHMAALHNLARARRPVVSLRRRAAHPRRPLGGNGPAGRLRKAAPTYGAGCVRLPRGRRAARNPGALRQGHRGGKAVARPRRSSLSSFLPYNLSGSAGGVEGGRRGPPRAAPRTVRPPGARETPPGLRPRGPRMRATAPKRRGPPRVPRTRRVGGTTSRGHGPAEG